MEFKIIREKLSSRGGGIEIDLTPFGFEGEKMSAYQNYLGGGMLGGICVNDTLRRETKRDEVSDDDNSILDGIGEELKKHFADKMGIDYEEHQSRPISAY